MKPDSRLLSLPKSIQPILFSIKKNTQFLKNIRYVSNSKFAFEGLILDDT
eukprot:GAHX01005021.1.p1 GENE.GAHX01005021.1~~GAHX01005021.1.p1  ORF type:complete len:50 (+),score=3.87 GAHX01005021.1:121-270(+)